jgi:release factor glutamine methyltransferase
VSTAALLAQAVQSLRAVGNENAAADARILLAAALGVERAQLISAMDHTLTAEQAAQFAEMIDARCQHKPVSQILGWREFYGRRFSVSADVLDPRPDSETLIDVALSRPFQRVLDLGTGSGALIITLLAERVQATGLAVDLSPAALAIAEKNAVLLGVSGRLTYQLSDWLTAVDGQYDLIICNPPYIGHDDWSQLSPDVRLHEPKMALTPGVDGLAVYRALAGHMLDYLYPNGRVVFEIGYDQGPDVVEILKRAGWAKPELIKDLNGHDRVVAAEKPR